MQPLGWWAGFLAGAMLLGAIVATAIWLFRGRKGFKVTWGYSTIVILALAVMGHFTNESRSPVADQIRSITVQDLARYDHPYSSVYSAIRTFRPDLAQRLNYSFRQMPENVTIDEAIRLVRPQILMEVERSLERASPELVEDVMLLGVLTGEYLLQVSPENCVYLLLGDPRFDTDVGLPPHIANQEVRLYVQLFAAPVGNAPTFDPGREGRVLDFLVKYFEEAQHGFETFDELAFAITGTTEAIEQYGHDGVCRAITELMAGVREHADDPRAMYYDFVIYGYS